MPGHSRFVATRWLTALAMAGLLLGGCSTWRMQGQAPATAISATPSPPHVRITLRDGTMLEAYDTVVRGDSLIGVGPADSPRDTIMYGRFVALPVSHPRIAVALSDIRTLEIRTHSGGRTALLVTGITVVLFVAAVIVAMAADPLSFPE